MGTEGIFGDWACLVETLSQTKQNSLGQKQSGGYWYWSVSYYISSAPATGAMAFFTAFPIIGEFTFGIYQGSKSVVQLWRRSNAPVYPARYSLYAFMFFYGLFLVNTNGVSPWHGIVVGAFIFFQATHWFVVAASALWSAGFEVLTDPCDSPRLFFEAVLAVSCVLLGFCSVLLGRVFAPSNSNPTGWFPGHPWLNYHTFWLGEVLGLCSGFAITPAVLVVDFMSSTVSKILALDWELLRSCWQFIFSIVRRCWNWIASIVRRCWHWITTCCSCCPCRRSASPHVSKYGSSQEPAFEAHGTRTD